MRRVLIATGGTGGHLFPAQQMADEMGDCEVLFAGHKLQSSPFFQKARAFCEIVSSNRNPLLLLKGIWQSIGLILHYRPDVVVGFGSFHSFPVLMAAVLLRKKIVLFEANCSFGKVNQFFSPFATKVALHFPIPGKKGVQVPLLPWKARPNVERLQARMEYGLDPNVFTILVFGGSQGARFLNETFPEAVKQLPFPVQVLHFTGGAEVKYTGKAVVKPFEERMEKAYMAADMAVCRCGASTVAELIRYKVPALCVPYPYAYDHQRKNGEFLGKGAIVLRQEKASADEMAKAICEIKERHDAYRKALQEIPFPEAVSLSDIVRGAAV